MIRSQLVRTYAGLALAVLIGCFIGYFLHSLSHRTADNLHHIEVRQGGWSYINPLLECEDTQRVLQDEELVPFKFKVDKFTQELIRNKQADNISVYFRELNDGIAFRIGETRAYSPASLLKVPLMIAVLKHAEKNPGLLNKKIRYDNKDLEVIQNTESGRLTLGNAYTVDQLVKRMIIFSDNIPTYLLDNTIPFEVLNKTYRDLGILNPYHRLTQPSIVLADPDYLISAATYASFFRILYNSSYLSREQSEWALQLLSETEYRDGLAAGVPSNIKIAHKFGIQEKGAHHEIKQLHDCGIIYYPDHPYLLCIMSSGSKFDNLNNTIQSISSSIFQEIDQQLRTH